MVVRDNPAEHRYEVFVGGELAGFTVYRVRDARYWFVHTEIDDAHRGKSVGAFLVRNALDDIRSRGASIVPVCPFVAGWIRRHPDYRDLVDTKALAAFKKHRGRAGSNRLSQQSKQ
jgi:hypothetical protein